MALKTPAEWTQNYQVVGNELATQKEHEDYVVAIRAEFAKEVCRLLIGEGLAETNPMIALGIVSSARFVEGLVDPNSPEFSESSSDLTDPGDVLGKQQKSNPSLHVGPRTSSVTGINTVDYGSVQTTSYPSTQLKETVENFNPKAPVKGHPKEWWLRMAESEGDGEVGAGSLNEAQAPVCVYCGDTHLTPNDRDDGVYWMCTRCPLPCPKCASSAGRGPFCAVTPCACDCHKKPQAPAACKHETSLVAIGKCKKCGEWYL